MSNVHGMIRSAYTFDPDVVSNETALDTGEDALRNSVLRRNVILTFFLRSLLLLGNCLRMFVFPSMLILRRRSIFKSIYFSGLLATYTCGLIP